MTIAQVSFGILRGLVRSVRHVFLLSMVRDNYLLADAVCLDKSSTFDI